MLMLASNAILSKIWRYTHGSILVHSSLKIWHVVATVLMLFHRTSKYFYEIVKVYMLASAFFPYIALWLWWVTAHMGCYSYSVIEPGLLTILANCIAIAIAVSTWWNKNSSGDEIANVNFFYDHIVHVSTYLLTVSIVEYSTRRSRGPWRCKWAWPRGIMRHISHAPICCNEVRF